MCPESGGVEDFFGDVGHNGSARRRDHARVMAKEDEPAEMVDPLQDLVLRLRDDEGASSSSPAGLALPTPLDRESAFGSWSESNEPSAVERRDRGRAAIYPNATDRSCGVPSNSRGVASHGAWTRIKSL
jgi:hypothetical protein